MRRPSALGVLVLVLVAWGRDSGRAPHVQLAGDPAAQGWTTDETMKVRMVDRVRISPDGRRVLYEVRTAELTGDKGSYAQTVRLANADGSLERQLTRDLQTSAGAEWSPDGRWIAFVSQATATSDGATLWLIAADGGKARQLDAGGTGVGNLAWSPDGSKLAFTMPAPPTPAQRADLEHPQGPRVIDADKRHVQLRVLEIGHDGAARGAALVLSPDSLWVMTDPTFGRVLDWSPDGSSIAFSHVRDGDSWNHWVTAGISVVTLTGELRPLALSGAMVPTYSADGRWIAFLAAPGPIFYHDLRVMVAPAAGGNPRPLARTFDMHPTLLGWSPDGSRVYVAEQRRTFTRLSSLSVDGSAPIDVDDGDAVLSGFSLDRSRAWVGFALQTLTQPMEAHVSRLDRFQPVQVSHVNSGLPKHPLPRTELVRWKSADGSEIEGLLTYPNGYAAGRRYPLFVVARCGGEAFQQSFIANPFQPSYWPVSELALRGYAVLLANSRGGVLPGYGFDYSRPIAKPKEKSYPDLMTAADHVIRMGVADSARIALAGFSNGGLATAYAITQTRRFKAAIVNAAGPDLLGARDPDVFGTGFPWMSNDLGAALWEDAHPYIEHSPLPHLGRVTTATLFLHGALDGLMPFNVSLHRALQQLGVPTEMVIYPGEGHGTEAPRHLVDIAQRTIAWLDRYVR